MPLISIKPISFLGYIFRGCIPFLTALLLKLYFKIRKTIRFDYESNEAIEKAIRRFQRTKFPQTLPGELPVLETKNFAPFNHQVAGHLAEVLKRYKYMVLKPMHKRDLFLRELCFYELFVESTPYANQFPVSYIPKYYGAVMVENSLGKRVPCIAMEDVTRNFRKPCVIDIKIGRETFEPTATLEKKLNEKMKYKYQELIGFRVTGFKVYDSVVGTYKEVKKKFGRGLTPPLVKHGLAAFFFNGTAVRVDIIIQVIEHLKRIQEWASKQQAWAFYSSSILIVYDADKLLSSNVREPVVYDEASALDQRHFLERCVDEYHLVKAATSTLSGPRSRTSSSEAAVSATIEDMSEKVAATTAIGGDREGCICRRLMSSVGRARQGVGCRVPNGYYRSEISPSPHPVEVRIIDHAHTLPSPVPDQNYLYGIKSLIGALEGIVAELALSDWSGGKQGHFEPCLDIAPALEAGFIK